MVQNTYKENGSEDVEASVAPFLKNDGPEEVKLADCTAIMMTVKDEGHKKSNPMEKKLESRMKSKNVLVEFEEYSAGRSVASKYYYDPSEELSLSTTWTDENELENLYKNMKGTRTREDLIAKMHGIFNKSYGKNKLQNGGFSRVAAGGKVGEERNLKNEDDYINNIFMLPPETRIS